MALSRLRIHAPTQTYSSRRTQEGKSPREIKRCLKRAIARQVYRLMETHAAAVSRNLPMTA